MIVIIIGLAIALVISLCFLKGSSKKIKLPAESPQKKESISP